MAMEGQISAYSKKKGVDICGLENDKVVVRADHACYAMVLRLNKDLDVSDVQPLHQNCTNGDHYLALYDEEESIYGCRGCDYSSSAPQKIILYCICLLYTSPSPRDATLSRMPSSA